MKFRTHYNSKSADLVATIIENEDLDVAVKKFVDALGDTVIEVVGCKEEVKIFKEIYAMVS